MWPCGTWLMAQRWDMRTRRYAWCILSTCCSSEMGLFALYLRIENSRQRRASSAAAAVTFFGTLRHTGLLWQEGGHIVPSQASACLRGVTDLNPGTEWPFSADSYAGLRLLNLHEQQTPTNMLLTMFNGRHKGGGKADSKCIEIWKAKHQKVLRQHGDGGRTQPPNLSCLFVCAALNHVTGPPSSSVRIRHLRSPNAKFGTLIVRDGLTWCSNQFCAAFHSFSLTDGVVNWTTVNAMF